MICGWLLELLTISAMHLVSDDVRFSSHNVGFSSWRGEPEPQWTSMRESSSVPISKINQGSDLQAGSVPEDAAGCRIMVAPESSPIRQLIWSDPVNSCESVGLFLFSSFEDRVSSSRGRYWRRLIKLIFAGRNRIIMIRRELPLTRSCFIT